MSYAWIVEKDHLDNKNVQVFGPCDINDELRAKLLAGEGEEFKMYDDDGELYYSGRLVGDYYGDEPLMDYGMPNAGAVAIYYKDKNGDFQLL